MIGKRNILSRSERSICLTLNGVISFHTGYASPKFRYTLTIHRMSYHLENRSFKISHLYIVPFLNEEPDIYRMQDIVYISKISSVL